MIVLDSAAILSFLKDEPGAATVEDVIRTDPDTALTVVGVAEVIDHLVRVLGVDEEQAIVDLFAIRLAPPIPVDVSTAVAAARLRAKWYRPRACAVSVIDCIGAETARRSGARFATSDAHLLDLCHGEGIDVIAVPDSSGDLWAPS